MFLFFAMQCLLFSSAKEALCPFFCRVFVKSDLKTVEPWAAGYAR